MSDYLTPLEGEPVDGDTVKVVDSEKWEPLVIDYPGQKAVTVYDGEMDEKEPGTVIPPPWDFKIR